MAKRGYTLIAEHLGYAEEDVRMMRYQPTAYDRAVYAWHRGYWAGPGRKPPRHRDVGIEPGWTEVVSHYDGTTKLWHRP